MLLQSHGVIAPGRNRLRVRARSLDGAQLTAFRIVHFDPLRAPAPADRALARALELRAIEIELSELARAGRIRHKRLEIEGER